MKRKNQSQPRDQVIRFIDTVPVYEHCHSHGVYNYIRLSEIPLKQKNQFVKFLNSMETSVPSVIVSDAIFSSVYEDYINYMKESKN